LLGFLSNRLGHEAAIYALAYDNAAAYVYSGDGNGWIVRWSTSMDNTVGKLIAKADVPIMCLHWNENISRLLAGDLHGYLHVIDPISLTIERRILAHPKGVFRIETWGLDMMTCGADGRLIRWSEQLDITDQVSLSKVGLRSMAVEKNHLYLGDGNGRVFQVDNHLRPNLSWKAHDATVFSMAIHGDKLITGGRDAMLRIGEMNGDSSRNVAAHWYTINKVMTINGEIVSLSRDKKIRVWSIEELALLQSVDFIDHGHIRSVNDGIFLEDDNQLWTCGDDKEIKIWEVL
jgi:WD40 repeat protein